MSFAPLRCGRCQTALRGAMFNQAGWSRCPGCRARTEAHVFPAFFDAPGGPSIGPASEDVACAFHPRKAAAATCGRCALPVCALCEVAVDGQSLCPTCANLGGREGRLGPIESEAVRYDALALMLGLWPLILIFTLWICWPVYLLTAAATFYVVVRYWQAPERAFVPRPRAHLVIAALLAGLQLLVAAGLAVLTVKLAPYFRS